MIRKSQSCENVEQGVHAEGTVILQSFRYGDVGGVVQPQKGRPGKQGGNAPGRRGRQRPSHRDSGRSCQPRQRNLVFFFFF